MSLRGLKKGDILEKVSGLHMSTREQKFEAAVEYSKGVIRGAFLLNGGATITIFAFFSQSLEYLKKHQPITETQNLSFSLLIFSLGVFFAVLCNGFAYLAQSYFKKEKKGIALTHKSLAFFCLFTSLGGFLWGIINVYFYFRSIGI